jgi:hypothetical protein
MPLGRINGGLQGELPFAPTIRYSLPFDQSPVAVRHSLPFSDLPICQLPTCPPFLSSVVAAVFRRG